MNAIREGAASDPDVAEMWARIDAEFLGLLRPVADALEAAGSLRPGLEAPRAADLLWMLNHPDVWRLLASGWGWSAGDYEEWLVGALCGELLGRSPRQPRHLPEG